METIAWSHVRDTCDQAQPYLYNIKRSIYTIIYKYRDTLLTLFGSEAPNKVSHELLYEAYVIYEIN